MYAQLLQTRPGPNYPNVTEVCSPSVCALQPCKPRRAQRSPTGFNFIPSSLFTRASEHLNYGEPIQANVIAFLLSISLFITLP